jgi:hypothetical protein
LKWRCFVIAMQIRAGLAWLIPAAIFELPEQEIVSGLPVCQKYLKGVA